MPSMRNSALALIAGAIVLCAVGVQPVLGQDLSTQSASIAKVTVERPDPVVEKPHASETERIAALEEALRQQSLQLEQMRESLAEQSRMLKELRASLVPSNASAGSSTVAITADTSDTQAGLPERVSAVESQVKKTSEAVSRQLGSMTFSGDIRLRAESFFGLSNSLPNADNPAIFGNELSPRYRSRIRARLAVRGRINDQFDWGLRLATGSFADHISTNQTLTDFYTRKPFALDQAFVNYRPKQIPGLHIQGGKFAPPWIMTEMTFDNDLMVEGLSESYSKDFKGKFTNLTLTAWQLPMLERNSAFVRNANGTINVDESNRAGRDLALYGGQVSGRFAANSKVALTLSVSDHYFHGTQFITPIQVFGGSLQLPVTITIPATPTTPAQTITTQVSIPRDLLVAGNANLGVTTASNNAVNRDGRLSSGFNLIDLIGQLELTHNPRFPVSILFNFVTNTQTHDVVTAGPGGSDLILPNHENSGLWAEVQVGKARERGDIQLGYTYLRIEKDAVLTPFNFSDVTQQSDMRGHRFNFSYTIDPKVTFAVIGIVTQRPNGLFGPFIPTPPGSINKATTRFQFDTTFRF